MRSTQGRLVLIALAALPPAALAGLAATSSARRSHTPVTQLRCFGAASRDPLHPCHDPRLRLVVYPTPERAAITPNAPCDEVKPEKIVSVCAFGARPKDAKGVFALVGDSHAGHWRAAFRAVARAKSWRGMSITLASCPFARIVRALPIPQRHGCKVWNRSVPRWFAAHPEVDTMFVGEQSSARVVVPKGRSRIRYMANGYLAAWRSLPASVKHIIVVRDTPVVRFRLFDCVERAERRRRPPGPACALPRHHHLLVDPAVVAAERARSDRVRVIDMTDYVCGHTRCDPVIGGALVYKDETHLTRVYATTLGPYLLRAVERLVP